MRGVGDYGVKAGGDHRGKLEIHGSCELHPLQPHLLEIKRHTLTLFNDFKDIEQYTR